MAAIEGQDDVLLRDKFTFVLGFNDEIFKFPSDNPASNSLVLRHHISNEGK